jgi:hypothetical protein
MSAQAKDLLELQRLAVGGAGALTTHLMLAIAAALIAEGVR